MVATGIKMVTFLNARLSTKLLVSLKGLVQSCLVAACYMWTSRGRRGTVICPRSNCDQKAELGAKAVN